MSQLFSGKDTFSSSDISRPPNRHFRGQTPMPIHESNSEDPERQPVRFQHDKKKEYTEHQSNLAFRPRRRQIDLSVRVVAGFPGKMLVFGSGRG